MIKNLVVMLLAALITLILSEVALRGLGWNPGQFQYNKWIEKVDSLGFIDGFTADENGVFKVDTAVSNRIHGWVNGSKDCPKRIGQFCIDNNLVQEIGAVYRDHYCPDSSATSKSVFFEKISHLNRPIGFDSLLSIYHQNPINEDGFYSISFNTRTKGKGRVLLLGDSFTWGHSTTNKVLSFSNQLLNEGYVVFNTGISGGDLPQYLSVLRTYGHDLKPDVVVVNIFIGNDLPDHERVPMPNIPILYSTNAGNLYSHQGDSLFTNMHSAYTNVLDNMEITGNSSLEKLCSKTVLTTLIWAFLAKYDLIENPLYRYPSKPVVPESRNSLISLIRYCEKLDVPLIVSAIPNLENGDLFMPEHYEAVFQDLKYSVPNVSTEHYNETDGHFNDEGHMTYANYLRNLIELELENR